MDVQSTQVNIKGISEVKIKIKNLWDIKVAVYINKYYQYIFYTINKTCSPFYWSDKPTNLSRYRGHFACVFQKILDNTGPYCVCKYSGRAALFIGIV